MAAVRGAGRPAPGLDKHVALRQQFKETVSPDAHSGLLEVSPQVSALDSLRAEMSLRLEAIIRGEAIVRWRDNTDVQNRMRNAMDDYLFHLRQERDIELTLEQMDAVIEACLSIARNRPSDASIFGPAISAQGDVE